MDFESQILDFFYFAQETVSKFVQKMKCLWFGLQYIRPFCKKVDLIWNKYGHANMATKTKKAMQKFIKINLIKFDSFV